MAVGFGVPRWNGFTMQDDWHLARVVAAIKSASQDPEKRAIVNALAAAIGRQQGRDRLVARKCKEDQDEAARQREEEAVLSALHVELRALRDTEPGMTLLDAVEYTTADPARRIALYGRCSAEDQEVNGVAQDDPRLLKIVSLVDQDLALLERRAQAEGFQV